MTVIIFPEFKASSAQYSAQYQTRYFDKMILTIDFLDLINIVLERIVTEPWSRDLLALAHWYRPTRLFPLTFQENQQVRQALT
jgi:hypothetical protein